MTSRELVVRTLNHEPVERVPRDLWPSPGVQLSRGDELAEMNIRYPSDIAVPEYKCPAGKRSQGKPYGQDRYTDAWGCTWKANDRGTAGELQDSPLADAANIAAYQPPFELLDESRMARVNRGCETTSRFVLARTEVQPFERLQFLRGPAAARLDLAVGTAEIRSLLARLHDFYSREIEMWAGSEVDGVAFGDAWGTDDAALLAAGVWSDLFKPLYREYCKILHAKDKFVFFQSGGNVAGMVGDLIKIGVDAIQLQWSQADLDRLAKRHRGRVTFCCGIDRPQLLCGGKCEEICQAVQRVRRSLDFGTGGVIAHCSWEPDVSLRNIALMFEQWMVPLPMHA